MDRRPRRVSWGLDSACTGDWVVLGAGWRGFEECAGALRRSKPGGDQIAVTVGDMAEVPLPGAYRLIYLVYNTLFNLLTQDDQVRCFENAARHLTDDGVFLVEAVVPDPMYALRGDQYVDAEEVATDGVTLDVGRYDRATQLLDECHVTVTREGTRVVPIVTRFVWPSEMDLMARIAGLRLHARWAGWQREPSTPAASGTSPSTVDSCQVPSNDRPLGRSCPHTGRRAAPLLPRAVCRVAGLEDEVATWPQRVVSAAQRRLPMRRVKRSLARRCRS